MSLRKMHPASKRSRRSVAQRPAGRRSTLEQLERRDLMTAVGMTPYDQLLLELINRARMDPAAEAARYGVDLNAGLAPGTITADAKQPLAPNAILSSIARAHSQDMLDNNYMAHTDLAGDSPSDRARAAGYPVGVAENIAWGGTTGSLDEVWHVWSRHRGLFESAGHRRNMLNPVREEAGVGVRFGPYTHTNGVTYNSIMATEAFGSPGIDPILTGVVYADATDGSATDDDFYSVGEQISAGNITATNLASGQATSTSLAASGGYALEVQAGTYDVVVTLAGGEQYIVAGVVVGSMNVKVDFETTTATVVAPNTAPTLAALGDLSLLWSQTYAEQALQAADVDGDALSYSVEINSLAYHLDQSLGLSNTGNVYEDWGGLGEKWVRGADQTWYYLTPAGQLFQWNGSGADALSGNLVGTLDASHHSDLSSLTSAEAGFSDAVGAVEEGTLLLGVDRDYDGAFVVTVTVSDGQEAASRTFQVDKGTALATRVDADLGLDHDGDYRQNWGGQQEKWLTGAGGQQYFLMPSGGLYQWDGQTSTPPAGTFVAMFDSTYYDRPWLIHNAQAAYVDADLGLYTNGNFYDDWGGQSEKWLLSDNGQWHYITPDGSLYRWNGGGASQLSGTLVAQLDASHHRDPRLLFDAQSFCLDVQLEITDNSVYYNNWGGMGEKWLMLQDRTWLFLTADGALYRWDNSPSTNLTGELIATVDASYHSDPLRLQNAESILDDIFASWGV